MQRNTARAIGRQGTRGTHGAFGVRKDEQTGCAGTMTALNTERLWSDSVSERLAAARKLDGPTRLALRERLRDHAPDTVRAQWPYGYATSINPLLVTLGVSPGSARSWKGKDPSKLSFEPPIAGRPHPHIARLGCSTSFGKRVLHLARTLLQTGDLTAEDAYAVFGNVVLNPGRSGEASSVTVDPAFAGWVLRSIRDQLRPRFLVCFGMKGNCTVAELLKDTFVGFDRKTPCTARRFEGYLRSKLTFEEWEVIGPNGNRILIVYWPQHPRRAPFSSPEYWQAACQEFAERHGGRIRP